MSSFKVGDRIVYFPSRERAKPRKGIVLSIGRSGKPEIFPIDVMFDNGDSDSIKDGPWIVLEAIYDSPLMKVLK